MLGQMYRAACQPPVAIDPRRTATDQAFLEYPAVATQLGVQDAAVSLIVDLAPMASLPR